MGTSKEKYLKPKSAACFECKSEITDPDVIGLSLKMLGRNTARFYCLDCLARILEVDAEYLEEKIREWKEQGCTLFS